MTWLILVAVSLAVFRVTRLVTTDDLAAPARRALRRRFPPTAGPLYREETGLPIPDTATIRPHWLVALSSCRWCLSVWLAAAAVLLLHASGFLDSWRWVVLAWPAVAGAAGLLGDWSS